MVKTQIICLLNRNYIFCSLWKSSARCRTKAQEYTLKILLEIINLFLNMEPGSPSIFTDIYIYIYI